MSNKSRNAYICDKQVCGSYVTNHASFSNYRSDYCMSYPNGKTSNEDQTGDQVEEMAESVSLLRGIVLCIRRRRHPNDPHFSAHAQNPHHSTYSCGDRTLPACGLCNCESDQDRQMAFRNRQTNLEVARGPAISTRPRKSNTPTIERNVVGSPPNPTI
jgi:hypothetical protein